MSLLPLTLFTLGLALGPLFIASILEIYGRRYIYIASMAAFLAFTGGCVAATNFATILVCRFLAGFLGSAGIAIGAGSVADIWGFGRAGGIASMLFILGPFLGPTLDPLVGAYILRDFNYDWRWTQYLLLIMAAPIWVASVLMKETSPRRTSTAQGDGSHSKPTTTRIVLMALMRPTKMLFTDVIVCGLTLYTAFAYAIIFSFFASTSYVYQTLFDFTAQELGLSLIAVIVGYILAALAFLLVEVLVVQKVARKSSKGEAQPELRLPTALIGSIFVPISLFWYAWAAHRNVHWAAVVMAGIPLGFGSFCIFISAITYLVQTYKAEAAASALAANGSIRYTLGAVFPLFTIPMYEQLGINWSGSVFAFASILLLPIPWLLYLRGAQLRHWMDTKTAE